MLLLGTRLVGIERRALDGRRGVVGAGLAVLVGLGLEGVFVLGVFAGELDWGLGQGPAGDDERGAGGAGGEEGAAEGGEKHCCGTGVGVLVGGGNTLCCYDSDGLCKIRWNGWMFCSACEELGSAGSID